MSPAGAVERITGRIGNGRRGIRAGIARITAVCLLVIAGIVTCGFDKHSAACVVKINVKANRLADIAQLVVVVAVDDVAVQCDLLAVEHDRRGGFADFLHHRGRIRKLTANGLIRRAGGQENAFILLIPTDVELTFGAAQQIRNVTQFEVIVAVLRAVYNVIALRRYGFAVDLDVMRRSLDLQTGLVARAADRRDRVANALETEHGADTASGNRNRLAARIRHGDFVYVIGRGALCDLHICYLADGVACSIHLLLNLICGERHRPLVLVRVLIRVSLALEIRVIAAPDVRCVLGCAAVRRIKVTDDRAAVVRQRFTLGGVHCGIRGLGCTVGAQIHLTVRGVAQIVITAVLMCAECKRTSTHCLRLLCFGRPVRVNLIRQHALHIILHTHIVYNSDAAVRCTAVHKIAVPLVALEPRQRAVRTNGDMVCTRCGRIQH